MGTEFRVTLYAADETSAKRAAAAAFGKAHDLDAKLSDYKPNSELMHLCAKAALGPVPVSAELFEIVQRAQEISNVTDGAFDITIGPVVRLWRLARRTREFPVESELEAAMAKVGFRKVILDASKKTIELKVPGMKLDLGGIAKGYAADAMLKVIKDAGWPQAIVSAGGDVVAGDAPPDAGTWMIGMLPETIEPRRQLRGVNCAISTSGDTYQSVTIDGTTYSHIVDPKTGVGLTNHYLATVIAKDGVTADALATALTVMEPETGLKLIERIPNAASRISLKVDGKEVARESKLFSKWLKPVQ